MDARRLPPGSARRPSPAAPQSDDLDRRLAPLRRSRRRAAARRSRRHDLQGFRGLRLDFPSRVKGANGLYDKPSVAIEFANELALGPRREDSRGWHPTAVVSRVGVPGRRCHVEARSRLRGFVQATVHVARELFGNGGRAANRLGRLVERRSLRPVVGCSSAHLCPTAASARRRPRATLEVAPAPYALTAAHQPTANEFSRHEQPCCEFVNVSTAGVGSSSRRYE